MYRSLFIILCVFTLVGSFLSIPAYAASPKKLGQFSYWNVYQLHQGKNAVCYMTITAKPPKARKKGGTRRSEVTLMVTHRPSEGALDVVSYAVGGKLKPSSNVKAMVGNKRFNLFTHADTAWARDNAEDHAISLALRAGYYVTFMGYLAAGDKFADTVNLKGSSKAYEMMSKACGVQVTKIPVSARPQYIKSKK